MSLAPNELQALYRSCMKDAASQGRTLMQRVVLRAAQEMPQFAARAPDVVERNLVADAARVLVRHDNALSQAFPQALLAEFTQAVAGDTHKPAAVSFDALELMADDQVQESVEVVRVQQILLHDVETELADLNTLVCAVQGLRTVQAERNPLRPEVYVRALRRVIQESPVSDMVRRRWLTHLGRALGPELALAYREIIATLRRQGVTGVGFSVVLTPESGAGSAGAAGGPGAAGMSAAGGMAAGTMGNGTAALLGGSGGTAATVAATGAAAAAGTGTGASLLNVHELRRLLSGAFDAAAPAQAAGDPLAAVASAVPAEFSMTVPAAFEALQEMKQVDQVVQRLRQRQAADPAATAADSQQALRELLRKQARGPGQALSLEVVTLMVDNICHDDRLLPAVQQVVRDLEPALMRLALADPRFFSDRRHPARQLLDELTQRSLAWTDEDAPGFRAFIDPLRQAVDALLETQASGAEPFAFGLDMLRQAWGEAQQRDRRQRERAVRSLLAAEQRNLLAERIGRELRGRADIAAAPRDVVQFLLGPWTQVMAQARLHDADGAADPGGYHAVVGDLIWSAQPALAATHPTRLTTLVPPLVDKLRQGLQYIDYPADQQQAFLDRLAALHEQGLRPSAEPRRPVPLSTTRSRAELEAEFAESDDSDAWLAPDEAQRSGFMPTDSAPVAAPLFQPTQAASLGATVPPAAAARTAATELAPVLQELGLTPGAWVEIFADGGWNRWQLSWASPHATLYMFSHASGKTQSMTRRLLEKMLTRGVLRMVSSHGVVDGALDQVAQAALRNSVDLKL